MKIILCCAGGLSTTMLMDTMKAVIKESKKLDEKDFEFKAIPVDTLTSELEGTDAVVIGPQISHKLDQIKTILDPLNIPYVLVDKEIYGQMDGRTVLKKVLVEVAKAQMNKEGKD